MIIYFVRHASAGQRKDNPKKDEKRALDAEGVHQCTQMGRILASLDASVDAILSSPLKRATQTAALVANELGYEGKLYLENGLRPDAKYDAFREMLRKYSKSEAVMVVGHNPNFSDFLGQIVTDNGGRAHVDMKKGSVAKVESEQKKFVLFWLITPRTAKAAADTAFSQSQNGATQNGAGLDLLIPAEYTSKKKKKDKKAKKKQPQPEAFTIRSRPKTSRK